MRLDIYLFKNGFAKSRSRAKELITQKRVKVDSKIALKPSLLVDNSNIIEIDSSESFVSRAGVKLSSFLNSIDINLKGDIALDIGSSTGGFTEVLLKNEVKEVYAIDVGNNQLDKSLREDKRVTLFENLDIREFKSELKFDTITCDVSFISLSYILKSIDKFANGKIIILFKPQFEVGAKVKRDRYGVVKDYLAIESAESRFLELTKNLNWTLIESKLSDIKGKAGNVEKFFYFRKNSS